MKIFLVLPFLLLTQALPVNADRFTPSLSIWIDEYREWERKQSETAPSDSLEDALGSLVESDSIHSEMTIERIENGLRIRSTIFRD